MIRDNKLSNETELYKFEWGIEVMTAGTIKLLDFVNEKIIELRHMERVLPMIDLGYSIPTITLLETRYSSTPLEDVEPYELVMFDGYDIEMYMVMAKSRLEFTLHRVLKDAEETKRVFPDIKQEFIQESDITREEFDELFDDTFLISGSRYHNPNEMISEIEKVKSAQSKARAIMDFHL